MLLVLYLGRLLVRCLISCLLALFLVNDSGRKMFTVIFAFVYAVQCLIKLQSNYVLLVVGRLLGGISTSLLFSVFEAWFVNHHQSVFL